MHHIYWFSATGNSWRATGRVETALHAGGYDVESQPINQWTTPLPDRPEHIIIVFPTLAWKPPALVSRFLRRLPRCSEPIPASVLTADAGGCYDAPNHAARILRRRGYRVSLVGAASYSENWLQLMPAPEPERVRTEMARGDRATDEFCGRLVDGAPAKVVARGPAAAITRVIGALFLAFGRRFLGKMFIADGDCTKCRLCERHCPVGAIVMRRGARPYWKLTCESCNRCVNLCPAGAINTSLPRAVLLVALIATTCFLLVRVHLVAIAPLTANLPQPASVVLNVLSVTLALVLGHLLALGPLDSLLVSRLQRIRILQPLFELTFTKGYRRYWGEGFRAPVERPARREKRVRKPPASD